LGERVLEERVLKKDEDTDDVEIEKVQEGSKLPQDATQVQEVQEKHKE